MLSNEHRAIRRTVREFGKEEIEPFTREYDESYEYPIDIIERAAEHDLVGPTIPREYGGADMDTISVSIITEEFWRADPEVACAIGNNAFITNVDILSEYGDEWTREEWFPKLPNAEAHDAIAVSEAVYRSDVASIETRAEKDDEWVINGSKTWTSNGSVADVIVVFAKTDPDADYRRISAFLVPPDADGLETELIDNKLGIHAADLTEMVLDDVRAPEDHLIGEENKAFYYFMESSGDGRITIAAQDVGVAQAALDASIKYTTEREQFGQPIADFQTVEHKIAEMATKTDTVRSLVYRVAGAVERGDDDAVHLAGIATTLRK